MKKLLLVSFLIYAGTVNAQWVRQHSNIYQYYNTIFFLDSLNGWVGGYPYPGDQFILRTSNGGVSWDQTSISSSPQSIYFTNISTGFCAAFNGIYKTTDGGGLWNLNYQDDIHFNSVQFVDENSGFAVANEFPQYLYLLKTEDAGLNWNKSLVAIETGDPKIKMIDELTGFIISENSSKIYKTSDGGSNWNVVFDDSISHHSFWDIAFSDELNGFAGRAGGDFLSTSDGGNTWHKKFMPLLFCTNIRTIENHCWVSGFGIGYNAIVYSDDYGNTWTPIFVDDSNDIHDIFFSDLNHGWFCSTTGYQPPIYDGFIYKIENGWSSNITTPSTPQQIHPLNASNFEQVVIDFEWEKLNYSLTRFQVSTDSLFNSFYVLVNPGNGDTTFFGNQLFIENNKTVAFPLNQKYYWRVRSENKMGVSDWSDTWSFTTYFPTNVDEVNALVEFNLSQNYPNPFNPSTSIQYAISKGQFVSLKIYDVLGNEVTTLVNEEKSPGKYDVSFDASSLSSGVYLYTIKAGSFIETKKMILLR
jgi:photosystem II stability/assembly factor-like uncharacterized protein